MTVVSLLFCCLVLCFGTHQNTLTRNKDLKLRAVVSPESAKLGGNLEWMSKDIKQNKWRKEISLPPKTEK